MFADFISEKNPEQAEGFLRNFVAGAKGIDQNQLANSSLNELKIMTIEAVQGFALDAEKQIDAEKQKIAQMINDFQPTGDILHDIDAIAHMGGSSLSKYFTDPITGEEKIDMTNPEAVYQHYMSQESQDQLNKTYDNPVYAAHVEAVKRILKAYKEK